MNLRLILLPVVMFGGLASIYLLPQAGDTAQSAVRMVLPRVSGEWELTVIPASKEEIGTLAKDTEFSKAICLKPREDFYARDGNPIPDRVDLSIVLSGHDLNNSIHRPERCMPAQGHLNLVGSDVIIKLSDGKEVEVRRLRSEQKVPLNQERTEFLNLDCVTYYFFVGYDRISNDHLERTFVDMKDRVFRGMDQRWAYVSVSTWYGKLPWIEKLISEEEAELTLVNYLRGFLETQIDWSKIRN